ncbi:MAG: hypothetical protein WBW84_03255 [Acidobacteriaceae bacterium]
MLSNVRPEYESFAQHYASLSDEELGQLSSDYLSLVPDARRALGEELKQRSMPPLFVRVDNPMMESPGPTIKIPTAGMLSGAIGLPLLVFAGWMAIGEYREIQRNLFFSGFFAPSVWTIAAITGLIGLVFVSVAATRWVRALRHPTGDD